MHDTQDELCAMEDRLHELDVKDQDQEKNGEYLRSRTSDDKQKMPERKLLLMNIRAKLDQQGSIRLYYTTTPAYLKTQIESWLKCEI